MTYFSLFPRKSVSLAGTSSGTRTLVDINKRISFTDYMKQNQGLFMSYRLKDHETLQDVSLRMYGKTTYHWILLLFNDIVDPWDDLPLSQNALQQRIEQNYPGYSLFMTTREFDGNFQKGEIVSAFTLTDGVETNIGYTATVNSWDATFRELVVINESNSKLLESQTKTVYIRGNNSLATGTFKRRTLHMYAPHHFENSLGLPINVLPLSDDLQDIDEDGVIQSPIEAYVENSQNPNVSIVTNYEYEEKRNDSKRIIKVLRPENVTQVIREMQGIFQ